MEPRAISPDKQVPGRMVALTNEGQGYLLYLPERIREPDRLTLHFHGAHWFAIQEHRRHQLATPLLAIHLGEGSTVYRKPFEDRQRLARLITEARAHLPSLPREPILQISSFSAGYGAVRELVKSPEYRRQIQRIVLCDSLYAAWGSGLPKRPALENIEPWLPYARAAVSGKKSFVLTHSEVPTVYANTAACATELIRQLGLKKREIRNDEASPGPYRLQTRCDEGGFHIWGYAGTNAAAHLVHVRRLAEVWSELDRAGQP